MNRHFSIIIFFLFVSTLCWAGGSKNKSTQPPGTTTGRTVVSNVSPSVPLWTGDGGKGIRLAVLEPSGKGLFDTEKWMLSMIQSSITGDFQKYSAMTIIDRQNLEKILGEQKQSLSENYSDDDYISIGKLTNARYILAGSITKTADAYMLELAITDAESGERKASYPPKAVSLFSLENLSAIREATVELLNQLGVILTEQGRLELSIASNTAHVQAETALARGITAQRQGTIVEALSYFIQASNYDSGLVEAASRMNILTANISSGNIGEDTRNEIAWRRQWVARLQETETFFVNTIKEPQPFYIVYSTDIQRGTIDWQKETIDLSVWMGFYPDFAWSNQINGVISAVKDGLRATGRAQYWELDWPSRTINTPSPFNNRINNSTSTVVVEIINDQGRSIGRQTVRAPYGYEIKGSVVTPLWQYEGDIVFTAIDANTITDKINIRISSIDGIAAEYASQQKKISIMPQAEWEVMFRMNPTTRRNIEFARERHIIAVLKKHADEDLKRKEGLYPESRSNSVNEYFQRGNMYYSEGDYDQAIANFTQALGPYKSSEHASSGRAFSYFQKGDWARAIEDFRWVWSFHLTGARAYMHWCLGLSYYKNGDYGLAIEEWEIVLRKDPNDPYARKYIEIAKQAQDRRRR
ncbi:MAG: tetratricopeptide repeat protein [Treponema sp.]|nr:tetratricopeptide repeat protein [Treponema sp.]